MLQVLTSIPVKRSFPCTQQDFRKAAIWFPVVGLLVGLLSFGMYKLGAWVLGSWCGAVFSSLFLVFITGALHNDGLADCFDAFFCSRSKEEMLAILKDSRIGTYGALALIFDILLRVLFVALLPQTFAWFIIVVPVLGRSSIALVCSFGKPAKKDGSGALFIGNVTAGIAVFCVLATLAAFGATGFFIGGVVAMLWSLSCVLIGFIGSLGFYRLCVKKIGGLTGDCLGGCCEIGELTTLFALVIIINRII
ncbi:MAG: adenosylcobinamide-GDP ribazoletransferase [Bacillota bacterium]|nr:adenosylcobinamide-GDP ribazoletransferase [Bacillota bacterium]